MQERSRIAILLVEDNDKTAQLAMEFLSAGLTEAPSPIPVDVLRTSSLAAALGALEEDTFDACVLDLNLPDSTGIATVEAMRRERPKLPILVLSASQDPDLTSALMKAGAEGFVSKWLDNPLKLAREVLLLLVNAGDGTMTPTVAAAVQRRLRELD